MNRVLVVFSDELLAQVDAARGLASRSAWIRSWCEHGVRVENEWPAVEEAVAPLVPENLAVPGRWGKGLLTDEEWAAFQEGAGFETPEETEILDRMHGITPEPETITVKRIRGRKLVEEQVPKPKARRKKLADPPGTHRDKSIASAERRMAIKSGLIPPDRCNRGACTGTINPVSGRCLHCNQTPLKESK